MGHAFVALKRVIGAKQKIAVPVFAVCVRHRAANSHIPLPRFFVKNEIRVFVALFGKKGRVRRVFRHKRHKIYAHGADAEPHIARTFAVRQPMAVCKRTDPV